MKRNTVWCGRQYQAFRRAQSVFRLGEVFLKPQNKGSKIVINTDLDSLLYMASHQGISHF